MSGFRILVVSEPMEYGVLSYLERLFEGIDRARWEPALVFSPRRMAPQARRLAAGLAARGVRLRSLPFHRGAGAGDAVATLGLVAELKAFRPHVVHAHSTKAGLIARVLGRTLGIPVLYTPHGTSWRYTGRFVGRAQLAAERALRRATSLLVAVCPEEARAFVEEVGFPAARVRLVPNGVRVPDRARLLAVREQTRAALDISSEGCWLVFVGRLTSEKGLDVLVRALAAGVPADGLLVVGDGPERPRLEAEARRTRLNVRFCGYQEDVSRFLAAADLFVQPSRSEGLPFTVLEAMAHGLPVVGSRVGGVGAAVDGCGRLVAPDRPAELAAALAELARDARLRGALGEAARTRVAQRFSVAGMVAGLHDVYAEACGAAVRSGQAA